VIEREILHVSDETNYEETNYMMSDFIAEQKKQFGC
jgi:starvation-inducible DNA-binding protein